MIAIAARMSRISACRRQSIDVDSRLGDYPGPLREIAFDHRGELFRRAARGLGALAGEQALHLIGL